MKASCSDYIVSKTCLTVCGITLLFLVLKVLVVIDAKPKSLGLPTEAYIMVEEVHDVSNSLLYNFKL